MPYAVVYTRNMKRVRVDGKLTPVFEYTTQAMKYIERILGDSPYVTLKRVGK